MNPDVRPCPKCGGENIFCRRSIALIYARGEMVEEILVGCFACEEDGFCMTGITKEYAIERWNLMAQGFGEIPENIVQIIEEMEKLDYCDACEVESQEHYCVANRVRFLARMLKGFTK